MDRKANRKSERVPFHTAFLDYLVEGFMAVLPHDPASCVFKRAFLRFRGADVGAHVKLWRNVWVDDYRHLTIGKNVTLGKSVMLICGGGVTIGDNCMIGHGAQIVSAGHRIPSLDRGESMRFSGPDSRPVFIADGVWVGAGAIVLPGTTIGSGAVVAAGAVVTKDVPENVVTGGVPASIIRKRC